MRHVRVTKMNASCSLRPVSLFLQQLSSKFRVAQERRELMLKMGAEPQRPGAGDMGVGNVAVEVRRSCPGERRSKNTTVRDLDVTRSETFWEAREVR